MNFEEKKEIVLKNWYNTDCKSPESTTVKEAYSLGFNRACKILRKENKRLQKLVEILQEEKKSLESTIMLQNTLLTSQSSKIGETCPMNPKVVIDQNHMMTKARIDQY